MKSSVAAIKNEIEKAGAIPFSRFMELALYHPEGGYYETSDRQIGKGGDFFTSVSVGPMFGELLAWRFAEWLEALECGDSIQVVEVGAHDGSLARDILSHLRGFRPDLFARLDYWIIEPSRVRRVRQETTLGDFTQKVKWHLGFYDIRESSINGVIFSNELLDAMPVSRLGWNASNGEWFEFCVAFDGETFQWEQKETGLSRILTDALGESSDGSSTESGAVGLSVESVAPLLSGLREALPNGYVVELCPPAVEWWLDAASRLRRGMLMAVDYGATTEELIVGERKEGTLRAYNNHSQSLELLANPSEQDITAHVNFSAIQSAGENEGLREKIFTTQARFLTRVLAEIERSPDRFPKWDSARARQFQTLVHPEHLGERFRALVQEK